METEKENFIKRQTKNGYKIQPAVDFLELPGNKSVVNKLYNYQTTGGVTFSEGDRYQDSELNNNRSLTALDLPKIWSIGNGIRRGADIDTCSINSGATSTTTVTKKKPNIPDGGYGWVVVFASFLLQLIMDGVAFSFGLIYSVLLEYFQESKTKTAWISALFLSIPLLAGPVLSNLVDKYGCRTMTIIGGLVGSIGFALGAFCNSVEMLLLTFGVISGLGIGIGYVTAVVSLAFWFDNKRTLATSFGAAGTGIGTFLYAPFTQFLLDYFGWRGATLILAGTMLNICLCGCLMRDPEWLIEENRLETRSQSNLTVSNSSVCLDDIRKMLQTGTPGETVLDTLMTNVNTEANQLIGTNEDTVHSFKKCQSEVMLPTYFYSSELMLETAQHHQSRRSLRRRPSGEISRDQIFSISSQKSPPARPRYLASAETLNISEKYSIGDSGSLPSIDDIYPHSAFHREKSSSRLSLDETLMNRNRNGSLDDHVKRKIRGNSLGALLEAPDENKDITIDVPIIDFAHHKGQNPNNLHHRKRRHRHHNTGEIVGNLRRNVPLRTLHHFQHIRIHRHSINYRGAILNTHRYRLKASSCPDIYRNSMTTLAKEEEDTWYDNFVDIMKSIFDFSMFMDPKFFIFNLSTFFLFVWFMIPYLYLPDHMLNYGYEEKDSARLISTIGVFNTVGMLVLGIIGDRPWINVPKVYAVCLLICGVTTALMPVLIESYWSLIVLCMIFGITFSSSFSFIPVILVELVELDDFTCAYGLVLLVQGVALLIGPPLAGIIYDITTRWDESFYAAGVFIFLSGILAWITGFILDNEEDSDDEDNATEIADQK